MAGSSAGPRHPGGLSVDVRRLLDDGRVQQVAFWIGLAVLPLATAGLARWASIGLGWQPVLAVARATVQLGVVAALLRGVITVPWTVAAFIALMLSTASWTSGGRIARLPHGRRSAALGVVAGAAAALVPALGLRLVTLDTQHVVALGGIVVGGAMNAATLSGRRFLHSGALRREEVEGWLALGATPVRANEDIARQSVREALLPNLDQTRATGLVTLPGAFVGALFGGAGPIAAAEFQLVVLAAIGLAMLVCALVVTAVASRSPYVIVE
ncbi:MAG: ABC transporter permease [Nocardioidaceae bacterium]|nr:ABC transporter permease [Nocardioidaceae bacterium]MCL2614287.1 ABC transporter permease [Nocardioidaceae bacterium]